MLFSQIPGLEELKAALIHAVKSNHVAHAQLFCGAEGGAQLPLALALATYINCEDKQKEDACGKCPSCSKFLKIIHPDLHFIFPVATTKAITTQPSSALFMKEWRKFMAHTPYGNITDWAELIGADNKSLQISVEEARNIVKKISLKSFESEFKILIIWLAEAMHVSAANSILKILEEPPEKTIFLLVTNQSDKIITTILSRTQRVTVRAFKDSEVANLLKVKYDDLSDKKAGMLAYLADGNMNNALQLIDHTEDATHDLFREWMRQCYKKNNFPDLLQTAETFQKSGKEEQKSLLLYGLHLIRECLIFPYAKQLTRLQGQNLEFVEKFSKVTDCKKLEEISDQLSTAFYHLERNANPKIVFLDTSLEVSSVLKSG